MKNFFARRRNAKLKPSAEIQVGRFALVFSTLLNFSFPGARAQAGELFNAWAKAARDGHAPRPAVLLVLLVRRAPKYSGRAGLEHALARPLI